MSILRTIAHQSDDNILFKIFTTIATMMSVYSFTPIFCTMKDTMTRSVSSCVIKYPPSYVCRSSTSISDTLNQSITNITTYF